MRQVHAGRAQGIGTLLDDPRDTNPSVAHRLPTTISPPQLPSLARESLPCQIGHVARTTRQRKVRRPWTALTATLTAAHHGFELSSGVGLVLQPEMGLGPACALWGSQIPVWIGLAARGDRRWDRLLAAW